MKQIKKYKLITIVIFSVLISSCLKEIDFNYNLIGPELVINGFPAKDSIIDVNIAVSKPIPGIEQAFEWLDDATVVLYVNGQETETLVPYDINDQQTGNGYYYSSYNTLPTTGYRSTTKAIAGNIYKLVVTHPNYKTATCETTIPDPVNIISLDTATVITSYEYWTDRVLNFKLKFNDRAGEKNYYRLTVKYTRGLWQPNYDVKEDTTGVIMLETNNHINSDDPLLNPDEDANDFLIEPPQNNYNLFTDDLIEGKDYEMSFNLNYNFNYYIENERETPVGEFYRITIGLCTLTREAYLYMRSSEAQSWYDGDIFSEPTQVFSNVENGTGILGGYSIMQKSIGKGEYPIDGIEYVNNSYYYY